MATVGDVNGDNLSDFIVGAPSASPGGRMDAGSAFVYSGLDGSLLYQKDGAIAGDALGVSVAGAGDVDGDGIPDFIIGAYAADSRVGIVYVYSGAHGGLIYQKDGSAETETSDFGRSVATAGDIDGDGKADFVVGAPNSYPGNAPRTGSVFVYSGATGARLNRWDGEATDDYFGAAVSGGGDVNADGTPDIIVGAPDVDAGVSLQQDGAVYVFSGADGSVLHKKSGDVAY
ncbi:MAG TPA: integrin alpha, partial [Planctomycetota bacterium]|nr:integrin alpha [Planctomycetota bacterium]